MKSEYDFSGGARGKHYKAYRQDHTIRINHSDGTHTLRYFDGENRKVTCIRNIPTNLLDELEAMANASDEKLWAAINPLVTPRQRERLEELNVLGAKRVLTPAEHDEQGALFMEHHHSILRRAQAIAILRQRGHFVSDDVLHNSVL